MKINGFLVTFNDPEYLEATLQSVLSVDYFHKFYIIEGSWRSAQESSGVGPRSDQETYDIINKYVDNQKVFLVQANEHRERDQRQVGLELAKRDGANWCHMFDSDEIYTQNSLLKIKNYLKSENGVLGYRINSYNFINSFKKWYHGNYMRIYRVTNGAKFYMDNDVDWEEKEDFKKQWPMMESIVGPSMIGKMGGYQFYHYNYVKLNKDAFWRKMAYQNEQDPSFNARILPQYGYDESQLKYKIPNDIKIYDFEGKHPKIMKDHVYFKNNIFNDSNLQFMERE